MIWISIIIRVVLTGCFLGAFAKWGYLERREQRKFDDAAAIITAVAVICTWFLGW